MLKSTLLTFLLATISLAACKNEPKTAPAVATPKLDIKAVEKTSTEGAANLQQMEQLIQELNALPASVKTKQAETINNMVAELNGMLEKESVMVNALKSMTQPADQNPTAGSTDSGSDPAYQIKTLNDYSSDMTRYHERVKQIQSEVKAMAGQKE